jgi:galactokinase
MESAMNKGLKINTKAMLPSELIRILESGSPDVDEYLGREIYANCDTEYLSAQRKRMVETLRFHLSKAGERPTYLLRAPGRLNAFLEYLDMCSGDHMSTTIDGDIPVAVSPRDDGILRVANINPLFPPEDIALAAEFKRFASEPMQTHGPEMADTWDNRTKMIPFFGRPKGSWLNYILSPYLRVMWEHPEIELRGADLSFGPANAPFRAGVSSSSILVVLSFLALYVSNQDKLPSWEITDICRMLGEAEWYVGTHGGANDQTTILCNRPNSVLYNRHSRDRLESTPLPFLQGLHIVLANSLWEVNKSLSGNQSFNIRKAWMEIGDQVMRLIIRVIRQAISQGRAVGTGWIASALSDELDFQSVGKLPLLETRLEYWDKIEKNYKKFGSLHEGILHIPNAAIEELISILPVKLTMDEVSNLLDIDSQTIERMYTKPRRSIGGYHLRTTARFFLKENIIGRKLEHIFLEADRRISTGELSPDSPEYDQYRQEVGAMLDDLQHTLRFDFRVSNAQLDRLLDTARRGPGYLGGKLTGAGKGGCVCILVRDTQSQAMCEYLDAEYYGQPANFEEYRQILLDALRYFESDEYERLSATERLNNLEKALASIQDQRRVITFSRGACALDFEESGKLRAES